MHLDSARQDMALYLFKIGFGEAGILATMQKRKFDCHAMIIDMLFNRGYGRPAKYPKRSGRA